jgi:hypothetical protein
MIICAQRPHEGKRGYWCAIRLRSSGTIRGVTTPFSPIPSAEKATALRELQRGMF